MRNINIDFYNKGKTIILGYTGEHLATVLNFIIPLEFRGQGFSYKLIFNLEKGKELMETFSSYPISFPVSNNIMSAGNSGHLQISVLQTQENGEILVAQGDVVPFKVLNSLNDTDTNIGEYTNTIEQLIAEFNNSLENINSREVAANKVSLQENINNTEENYPSIQYLKEYYYDTSELDEYLEENYYLKEDIYTKEEIDKVNSDINNTISTKANSNLFLEKSKIHLVKLTDIDQNVNGLNIRIRNNHVSIKGTPTGGYTNSISIDEGIQLFEKNKSYIVSTQNVVNNAAGTPNIYLWGEYSQGGSGTTYQTITPKETAENKNFVIINTDETRTLNLKWNIQIPNSEDKTYDIEFDFMIQEGDIVSTFEPYYSIYGVANNSITASKLSEEVNNKLEEIKEKELLSNKVNTFTLGNANNDTYLSTAALADYHYDYIELLTDDVDILKEEKYDKSNVERGTGSFGVVNTTSAKSGTFTYTKIDNVVFVNAKLVFKVPTSSSSKFAQFTELPCFKKENQTYSSGRNIFVTNNSNLGKYHIRYASLLMTLDDNLSPLEDETADISFFYFI